MFLSGHLTTMSDVYSFGVVLLELLTGKRSIDSKRPNRDQSLVEWVRPMLRDPRKLQHRVMDPRLEEQYPVKAAQKVAMLAFKCLSHHPKPRPTMREVVKTLESLQDYEDSFVEPFVYVVPNGNKDFKNKENGRNKKGNSRREVQK